jgi:hypothetical protein
LEGSAMKARVLLCSVLFGLGPAAAGTAQPVGGCASLLQGLNSAAATINQNATAYWSRRAQYVDLIFGLSGATVANATQVADQNKAQGDALRAGMPSMLANFKDLAATAQSQGCPSASQLSAIIEPTIKLAKRINFDQFPEELPLESTVQIGPPRLPH